MDDVLDEKDPILEVEKFSRKSYNYAITNVVCVVVFVAVSFGVHFLTSRTPMDLFNGLIVLIFCFNSIAGFIMAVQSITKRERKSAKKNVGIILNTIFFILFILLMMGAIGDIFRVIGI